MFFGPQIVNKPVFDELYCKRKKRWERVGEVIDDYMSLSLIGLLLLWALWLGIFVGSVFLASATADKHILLNLLAITFSVIIAFHFFVMIIISEDIIDDTGFFADLFYIFDSPRHWKRRKNVVKKDSSKVLQGVSYGNFNRYGLSFREKIISSQDGNISTKLIADVCYHSFSKGWHKIREMSEIVYADINNEDWMENLVASKHNFREKAYQSVESVEEKKVIEDNEQQHILKLEKIVLEENKKKQEQEEELVLRVLSKS